MPLVVRIPQHSTVRSQRHELTALMAQKGSLRVRHISVRRVYPGFNAHEAGSDVPSVPFLHSTEADLRLPAHPTAAEAHPARSLCAMFAPATFSVGKQGHQELYPRGTLIQHTVGCPSVPLVRLDSTAFNDQVSASRTHSSHGTEGQSPCAAYTRDSTHTRPGPMCHRCHSFTVPMLIFNCRPTQPLLRHIGSGLRVHVSTTGKIGQLAGILYSDKIR